ncbi:MAG: transposase [Oscillospiraceae bacterium]|nr:transposase [Oscillospiraceae bacterium]
MKNEMQATNYPSNMTDMQWAVVEGFFKDGNKSLWPKRELVNGVIYRLKTGCQWRFLPKDFPPYATVHTFYRRARLDGTWERMQQALVKKTRVAASREPEPSYAIIDSQSAKTASNNDERGIDGGKKRRGENVTSP